MHRVNQAHADQSSQFSILGGLQDTLHFWTCYSSAILQACYGGRHWASHHISSGCLCMPASTVCSCEVH
jgi:hypothetical protein